MGWISGGSINTLAVHAAVLPNGQILYFGGSDYNPDNHAQHINHACLFHCQTFAITTIEPPTSDAFCCDHAILSGGRLLVAGGTELYPTDLGPGVHHDHWPGARDTWIYDSRVNRWTKMADMHGGRWYPTMLTLADGRVFASSGHPEGRDQSRHINHTPEIFDGGTNQWLLLPALGDPGREFHPGGDPGFQVQYPRMHLLPNGDIFIVTPPYEHPRRSLRFNPTARVHTFIGEDHPTGDELLPQTIVDGHNTTSVLLPYVRSNRHRTSVLVCGAKLTRRIDLDDPVPSCDPPARVSCPILPCVSTSTPSSYPLAMSSSSAASTILRKSATSTAS